jgi:DNA-directed RNA polymerase specialized sigma24 family protein
VIALHYYEDYSIAQIAAALGRAPGTIKAQLRDSTIASQACRRESSP